MRPLAIVGFVVALVGAAAPNAQYGVPSGAARIGKPSAPALQPRGEVPRCHTVSTQRERRSDVSCGPQAKREFEIQEIRCSRLENGTPVGSETQINERPLDCVDGDLQG